MKKYYLIFLLVGLCSGSYAQWNLIKNFGINYSLSDMNFINKDTGFVVGQNSSFPFGSMGNGFVAKTTNGGMDWDFSPFPYWLCSVYFLNKDTGFIGGEVSSLYRTYDGGTTWDTLILNPPGLSFGHFFISFYFSDNQHGFASNSHPLHPLWQTNDGGNTWEEKQIGASVSQQGMGHLMFSSDSIGYLDMSYKTTDGGNTWEFNPFNGSNLLGINLNYGFGGNNPSYHCLDDTLGYIMGFYWWSIPYGGVIEKTTNSGESWEINFLPKMYSLNSIYFASKNVFYLAGYACPDPNETPLHPFYSFLKSEDRGESWYYQESNPDSLRFNVGLITFPQNNRDIGYAIGHYNIGDTMFNSVMLKTTNGGGPLCFEWEPVSYNPNTVLENQKLEIKLYPNPATSKLNIQVPNPQSEKLQLKVFNLNGQVLINQQIQNIADYSLDISKLPQGNYLLKLLGKNEVFVRKFVIIR